MHKESRTIVVSSGGMYTQKLVTKDIFMTKDFDGTAQYARNKRQQVCMMEEFQRRYPDKGLFVSMHPGWVQTDMGGSHAAVSPPDSAAGILRVVAGLTAEDNGKFYIYNGEIHPW